MLSAILIIVLRLPNNLFHGTKWAYGIREQLKNFQNANRILMAVMDMHRYSSDRCERGREKRAWPIRRIISQGLSRESLVALQVLSILVAAAAEAIVPPDRRRNPRHEDDEATSHSRRP